ncbi:MAG: DoxX family protein [Actinomycetota bacterium]
MTIAQIMTGTLRGFLATASATGKLTKRPDVIASMTRVGVPERQIPALAGLELLGSLGLIMGIWKLLKPGQALWCRLLNVSLRSLLSQPIQ